MVGSRHVDDALLEYTMAVGQLAARSKRALISGGAKGIDQAAMRGAVEAGGKVIGVVADSLQRTTTNREHRNLLIDGQMALISPYDPNAGFNVGNAMQRNKLIYALADAALVVSSDLDKGGTWAGAVEQLTKFKFVPVYVRSTGDRSPGLNALRSKGAIDWPNPSHTEEFETFIDSSMLTPPALPRSDRDLFEPREFEDSAPSAPIDAQGSPGEKSTEPPAASAAVAASHTHTASWLTPSAAAPETRELSAKRPPTTVSDAPAGHDLSPAELLYSAARESIVLLLTTPMKDSAVATALNITHPQAKAWLQRLVDEGWIEKQKKPAGYIAKKTRLFG